MEKLIIGSHVSYTKDKQLYGSVLETLDYGANTFMFYTGAPQNTVRTDINKDRCEEAYELMEANHINPDNVIIHAPYIVNLANDKNHDFSVNFLKQEIDRSEKLGIRHIVLHPGSHVGLGIDKGIENIIMSLNEIIDENTKAIICLETMAGKGSEIGSSFEELKKIIDGIKYKDKIKVCLDTCHLNDAGYNISSFDKVLEEFDKVIGLSYIGCVHINDSANDINTHKDRHANIGLGTIGFDNLIKVIYNDKLKDVPKILETPYIGDTDDDKKRIYPPYRFEIEMIKNKKFNKNLLNDIREYYK